MARRALGQAFLLFDQIGRLGGGALRQSGTARVVLRRLRHLLRAWSVGSESFLFGGGFLWLDL
jgi:hypothetical protein